MLSVTPVQVRLPDEERDALDNYRREQKNPPSRARAVRELIRRALSEGRPAAKNVVAHQSHQHAA
jgi:metal-responsive CopG/Arc/MetJ family transcriptional regulator